MLVDLGGYHLLILMLFAIVLPAVALVQTWRDGRRSLVAKIVWTVIVVALPVLGLVGWFIDYVLGRAVVALQRRNERRRLTA